MKHDDEKLTNETVKTNFESSMTYSDYLNLDKILSAQSGKSDQHDEQLFIIIHQVKELWMKLMLHEINAAALEIETDNFREALKKLARVSSIQRQLISSWDVLTTMTPADYLKFRDALGHASGFQSYQNRMVEFSLGFKSTHALEIYQQDKEIFDELTTQLNTVSLYDQVIRAVHRAGFKVDKDVLNRDITKTYTPNDSVKAAFKEIYLNTDEHFILYEMLEKLVDVEEQYARWRFRHMKTVERVIGFKKGTGGSSGVNYLRKVVDHYFFKELWELRTDL